MWRSFVLAGIPYIATIVGVPIFNSTDPILGFPPLVLWISTCVLLTPLFLWLAQTQLPESERDEN